MRIHLLIGMLALAVASAFTLRADPVTAAERPQQALPARATQSGAAGRPATPATVPPPATTPSIRRILKLMANANTWGHPDLKGEFQGMENLFKGKYQAALKNFKLGARYASKPSQAAIAMMYLNGRGVTKDRIMACAWLALAAQRKTPLYVRLHNAICSGLSHNQHTRAQKVLTGLMPLYGDKVARQRMKWKLLVNRMILFGPRVVTLGDSAAPIISVFPNCHASELHLYIASLQIPQEGCGPANPAVYWDPKQYFAALDAQVTVSPLRVVPAPATSTGKVHAAGRRNANGAAAENGTQ